MVLSRLLEPPDLVVATVRDFVTLEDQQDVVSFVRNSIATVGSVRLLIHFEQFAGWVLNGERNRLWLRDDEGVSRIAVVIARHSRHAVETVIARALRHLPIAFFETDAAARRWLEAPTPHAAHATST